MSERSYQPVPPINFFISASQKCHAELLSRAYNPSQDRSLSSSWMERRGRGFQHWNNFFNTSATQELTGNVHHPVIWQLKDFCYKLPNERLHSFLPVKSSSLYCRCWWEGYAWVLWDHHVKTLCARTQSQSMLIIMKRCYLSYVCLLNWCRENYPFLLKCPFPFQSLCTEQAGCLILQAWIQFDMFNWVYVLRKLAWIRVTQGMASRNTNLARWKVRVTTVAANLGE